MSKPRVGIYSLTGCAGDQLMILNLEDDLLDILDKLSIVAFQEASSVKKDEEVDIALVEGSVSTKTDLKRLEEIRKKSNMVIAIGDCAIGGCVQAMRNGETTLAEKMRDVYGKEEEYFDVVEPYGLSKYVKVDLEIPGCPIETTEIRQALLSLLQGNTPDIKDYPVCVECKRNEYPCILVDKGMPCLGPTITAGCYARCPSLDIDCVGCRGPIKGETNAAEGIRTIESKGFGESYIVNRLRFFGANSEEVSKVLKTKQINKLEGEI